MVHDEKAYRFGISEYTTWRWSFEEDLERYGPLSDTIEICEFKLDKSSFDQQLNRVQEHGLTISSVQPAVHTLYPDSLAAEPSDPKARMALVRQAISRIAPHAPPETPFVVNTGISPDGNIREALAVAQREFRALADFAADYGMRIALEPLNPILMNTNTFIWTIPQALEIIASVDRPNFGICLDTWNNWQDPLVIEHIRQCGALIFVVHVSDWQIPRSHADRTVIGRGRIPMAALLRAISETGYRGAYTLEIFSSETLPDSLWNADGVQVITESKAGLDRAWREAFSG